MFGDQSTQKQKIKVGVIGVGNCFAGLVQGIEFYKQHPEKQVIGLMHQEMAGYKFDDIEFVSAFDVGANKIGKTLNEAVYAVPNLVNWTKLEPGGPRVVESPVLDGVGLYVGNKIQPLDNPTPIENLRPIIIEEIRRTETEVLINYLPVGSQRATEFWAEVALETGCAFVNCIPSFIASDLSWEQKFKEKNVPIIGDDIKGQVGATIVHRVLSKLCNDRGTKIQKTYQLNVGGNTDFLNMKEQNRLISKKISKTESVTSQIDEEIAAENIYVGPSDFIPFLGNTKLCFIRIEGNMFADIPYNIELRLDVDDKANSAGVVIDCIRCAKIALDRKIGGYMDVSSYYMKHPLHQVSDSEAKQKVEKFVKG
ncbi:inositol-3-phosphate synthase [Patescibacteria group bacterium]